MKRKLDDWLGTFLQWKNRSEAPLLYRTWTGLSVIASALQRKTWCIIEGKVFPNMFVVLVGPSGVRKGTAMNPGLDLIQSTGISIASNAVTRPALIRAISKSGRVDDTAVMSDKAFHSSLTVFSKEFTVFLGYNNLELISDLCDLYDCDKRWEYSTKDETLSDTITNVWLNIIGATTPDSLVSAIPKDIIGGGLTSRMILVFEDKEETTIPDPWNVTDSIEIEKDLIHDLLSINSIKGEFIKTDNFLNHRYLDWYMSMRKDPPFSDSKFQGYNKRRAIHLIKVCMILSASRGHDMEINEFDFDKALSIIEATEKNMTKVFQGMGRSTMSEILSEAMAIVASRGEIERNELLDIFKFDCDSRELEGLLITLEKTGFLKIAHQEKGAAKIIHCEEREVK